MTVRVLFFSVLRDVTGESEIPWELQVPAGGGSPRVSDLLDALYARWPALRAWDGKLLLAADLCYVTRGQALSEGQEVAIMPPVQGG